MILWFVCQNENVVNEFKNKYYNYLPLGFSQTFYTYKAQGTSF